MLTLFGMEWHAIINQVSVDLIPKWDQFCMGGSAAVTVAASSLASFYVA